MTIGERIKLRREELGMTQEELAKLCGYKSRSSINKIELSRDLPLKKVKQMADALQTTPSDLMGWVEEMEELQHQLVKDRLELNSLLEISDSEDIEDRQIKLLHAVDKYLNTVRAINDVTQPVEKKEVKEVNPKAIELYELYEKANPNVKAAIDSLLKATQ